MFLIIGMIQGMATPQADRKLLFKQMQTVESYQESRHIGHCSGKSDCATH